MHLHQSFEEPLNYLSDLLTCEFMFCLTLLIKVLLFCRKVDLLKVVKRQCKVNFLIHKLNEASCCFYD